MRAQSARLERVVRALSWPLIRRHVRARVAGIEGLENLPETGGYVLAPNHLSYYDHFLLLTVLRAARSTPLWFLTKSEAFEGTRSRIWHESWHSIAVDRSGPGPSTMRHIRDLLRQGQVVCIYPEGTRGSGSELLDFKDGPFRFADLAGVPVVPVGLSGTGSVLPRGRGIPRRGEVRVAFGTPLGPLRGGSRRERTDTVRTATRSGVEALIARTTEPDFAGEGAASAAAAVVDRQIADGLGSGGLLDAAVRRRLVLLIGLAKQGGGSIDLDVQSARLQGLRAMNAPAPLRPVLAAPVRPALRRVLREQPDHPLGNYLLGRWMLVMPAWLGGGARRAVAAFSIAAATAPGGDTRALAGVAEAQLAVGRPDAARSALLDVIETTDPQGRGVERIARARLSLDLISAPRVPEEGAVR